jgi:hypothetical protein
MERQKRSAGLPPGLLFGHINRLRLPVAHRSLTRWTFLRQPACFTPFPTAGAKSARRWKHLLRSSELSPPSQALFDSTARSPTE